MAKLVSSEKTNIRLGGRLSEVFERFRDKIRERAYHLSQARDTDRGSPLEDWLEAQAELSEPTHLEVKEQKKSTVVEVTLKGFAPQEIEIEVEGHLLQIFGFHSEISSHKKNDGDRSESNTRWFYQSVPLHFQVDMEQSHAKLLKNGKLKVVLAKQLASETRAA